MTGEIMVGAHRNYGLAIEEGVSRRGEYGALLIFNARAPTCEVQARYLMFLGLEEIERTIAALVQIRDQLENRHA